MVNVTIITHLHTSVFQCGQCYYHYYKPSYQRLSVWSMLLSLLQTFIPASFSVVNVTIIITNLHTSVFQCGQCYYHYYKPYQHLSVWSMLLSLLQTFIPAPFSVVNVTIIITNHTSTFQCGQCYYHYYKPYQHLSVWSMLLSLLQTIPAPFSVINVTIIITNLHTSAFQCGQCYYHYYKPSYQRLSVWSMLLSLLQTFIPAPFSVVNVTIIITNLHTKLERKKGAAIARW